MWMGQKVLTRLGACPRSFCRFTFGNKKLPPRRHSAVSSCFLAVQRQARLERGSGYLPLPALFCNPVECFGSSVPRLLLLLNLLLNVFSSLPSCWSASEEAQSPTSSCASYAVSSSSSSTAASSTSSPAGPAWNAVTENGALVSARMAPDEPHLPLLHVGFCERSEATEGGGVTSDPEDCRVTCCSKNNNNNIV